MTDTQPEWTPFAFQARGVHIIEGDQGEQAVIGEFEVGQLGTLIGRSEGFRTTFMESPEFQAGMTAAVEAALAEFRFDAAQLSAATEVAMDAFQQFIATIDPGQFGGFRGPSSDYHPRRGD